jgi:predicted peptidase
MATVSCRLTSSSIVEQDVDRFTQHVYKDPETGCEMPYNLYLPKDYDPNKSYPLVFFVADASANINNTKTPLFQGNGATVWTEPEEQAKHPCIVLAPQYTQDLVQSIGMMTTDENVWTPGLTLVTHLLQDTIKNYAVDKTRIYGTGQSQGGMTNIAISDRYPDLFAAQWLVACQWNVQEMAAMKDKKLWITVCEGDNKAFPGMNEATALWESLGSPVARNASPWWNSKSPVAELDKQARELAAQGKKINYTVFANGNHMYTWSFAYGIDAIRDWLFAQKK